MSIYRPQTEKEKDFIYHLRGSLVKVTPVRLELMRTLSADRKPQSLRDICEKITDHDKSTLQRSLHTLVRAKLVKVVMFDRTKNLYEINVDRPHHHHIVCTSCGFLEKIDYFAHKKTCATLPPEKIPKSFAQVTDHSLEFFGICTNCIN